MVGGVTDGAPPKAAAMTINGCDVDTPDRLPVVNPATELVVACAPVATLAILDKAVAAARTAFPIWRATAIATRRLVLNALADRIDGDIDQLAALLTAEVGKPIRQARNEVTRAAQWLRDVTACNLPEHINFDTLERLSVTNYVPIGVVGAIVPWNYPVLLAIWKIAPALLCGNTIIVKPSPHTPLTMLRIGTLSRGVVPNGVLNVVSGDDELGPWMTAHPGIDKIAFTGSTATGRRVMASAATNLKRLTLELGGNDASIVLADADSDVIIPSLFSAAFGNSGQICLATKRLYIHDTLFDRIVEGLAVLVQAARMGNGADPDTGFGPVQNRAQFDRVNSILADSRAHGHHIISGQTISSIRGFFIPLTIVVDPPDESRVVVEEAFGPILPVMRYRDIDDVIARANKSPYGLGASIWTADPFAAQVLASRLEVGTIWINETRHVTPDTTLAGHKQSGFGVELGIAGLLEYVLPQTTTIKR